MLESYFHRQNQAGLLLLKDKLILDDRSRQQIVNCIVDFMIEALGKGDASNITDQHENSTAKIAVALFVGLKSVKCFLRANCLALVGFSAIGSNI